MRQIKVGDKVKLVCSNNILSQLKTYTVTSIGSTLLQVDGLSNVFRIDDFELVDQPIINNKKESALNTQVGGSHYKDTTIQPIEFIHANNLNFCQGNIIKYVTRYKNKKGKEDLEKAKHYIDLLMELEYGDKK